MSTESGETTFCNSLDTTIDGHSTNTNNLATPVKLFVGRLPLVWNEETLRQTFEPYGSVVCVTMLKSKDNTGCAFVNCHSLDSAQKAINELEDFVPEGESSSIQIQYATGEPERLGLSDDTVGVTQKLFVGSVPRTVTDEDVVDVFKRYGKVTESFSVAPRFSSPVAKRSLFIRFSTKSAAAKAMSELHAKFVFPGAQEPIEVNIAGIRGREKRPFPDVGYGMDISRMRYSPGYGDPPMNGHIHSMRPDMDYGGSYGDIDPRRIDPSQASRGAVAYEGFGHGSYASHDFDYSQDTSSQGYGQGSPRQSGPPPPPPIQVPRTVGVWTEYINQPDGKPYYYNSATSQTQWEVPLEFANLPPPPAIGSAEANDPYSQSIRSGSGVRGNNIGGQIPYGAQWAGTRRPVNHSSPYSTMSGMGGMPSQQAAYPMRRVTRAGPLGANVFIYHAPSDWGEAELAQHFSRCGNICTCKIMYDVNTGASKGYGFVSFDTVDAAMTACRLMHGFRVPGGRSLKVQIKKGEEEHAANALGIPLSEINAHLENP